MYSVDKPISLAAIVYLAVIGPCVFILQPGYVQGLIEYAGYDEVQAANIVAIETFAMALTTIILNFFLHHFHWHKLTYTFLALATAGNLASIFVLDQQEALMGARALAGLGFGGIISITFTMMGLSTATDRNFGFIIMAVLTYGTIGLFAMPELYHVAGLTGALVFFTAFCASGFLAVTVLPSATTELHSPQHFLADVGRHLGAIVIAAVLLYNIAIGLVWVYMFNVGTESGIEEQEVANALAVSQALGIAGAFVAVLAQDRFGRMYPLLFSIGVTSVAIYSIIGDIEGGAYWFGVCLFNFMWNMSMPYILALLSEYDSRGNFVAYGVSMQMLGYAVGPFLAGLIFASFGFDGVNATAVVLFIAAGALFVPALLAVMRKRTDARSLSG